MPNSFAESDLETEGNEVSSGFHHDKSDAVRCWQAAVDAAGVDDKVLAAECDMSKGYYSKVASGQQGDLIELAYRLPRERAAIRADFFGRLAASERVDPMVQATEQIAVAALRFLRLKGELSPLRMAKAAVPDRKKRTA